MTMATIANDPNGRKRVLFSLDGDRKAIRLGKASDEDAATVVFFIERLVAAHDNGRPIDSASADWLDCLPDQRHDRIARTGLVPGRRRFDDTLGDLLDAFFDAVDVKPGTLTTYRQTETSLEGFFGRDKRLAEITLIDGERWRASMREAKLAGATISKRVKTARQILRAGVKWGWLTANPFDDLKAGQQHNRSRAFFVSREAIAKVIDEAPSAEWRLLIALSRYGGLRVPSEAAALEWRDIDWAKGRITIRSSKTEAEADGGERVIPLFPEIKDHLLQVFEAAPEGASKVIPFLRPGYNPHTQLLRLIRRAGLAPWPRAWHNMRASRQTELASEYPLHTVCAWIGNSVAVADRHYLTIGAGDWARATGDAEAPEPADAQADDDGAEGGAKCGAQGAQNAAQHEHARERVEAQASHTASPDSSENQEGNAHASAPKRMERADHAKHDRPSSDPTGIRTPVSRMRTWRPGPG